MSLRLSNTIKYRRATSVQGERTKNFHDNRVTVMMLLLVSRKLLIKEYWKKKSMIAG